MNSQRLYVSSYSCDPGKNCYCGSDQAFGGCCGRSQPDREPPEGVKILPNLLSYKDCRRLVRYADKQTGRWLTVQYEKKSTPMLMQK